MEAKRSKKAIPYQVSGLLTGRDIYAGLKGKPLGEKLLIPANALRDGCFLDDVSLKELSAQLNTQINEVKINGFAFVEALLQGDQPLCQKKKTKT